MKKNFIFKKTWNIVKIINTSKNSLLIIKPVVAEWEALHRNCSNNGSNPFNRRFLLRNNGLKPKKINIAVLNLYKEKNYSSINKLTEIHFSLYVIILLIVVVTFKSFLFWIVFPSSVVTALFCLVYFFFSSF